MKLEWVIEFGGLASGLRYVCTLDVYVLYTLFICGSWRNGRRWEMFSHDLLWRDEAWNGHWDFHIDVLGLQFLFTILWVWSFHDVFNEAFYKEFITGHLLELLFLHFNRFSLLCLLSFPLNYNFSPTVTIHYLFELWFTGLLLVRYWGVKITPCRVVQTGRLLDLILFPKLVENGQLLWWQSCDIEVLLHIFCRLLLLLVC